MDDIKKTKVNRILTSMIDGLMMFVIFWVTFIFPLIDAINALTRNTFSLQTSIFLLTFFFLGAFLDVLYLFLTSIAFKGATLGMKMNGLTYVKYDGSIPTHGALFAHSVTLVIIIIFSFGLSIIVDLFSLLCNKMGRNFHDIFLGMKMVNVYEL